MPTFKISHIGREKITNFHRVNKETLLEDPLIKEYDEKDIDRVLKITQQSFRDTGKLLKKKSDVQHQEEKEQKEEITPLTDILAQVNKDDVLKKKKKRSTETSISTISETQSSQNDSNSQAGVVFNSQNKPEFVLSYARPTSLGNTMNYFGTNNLKQRSAVRVTLYNKGFERDMM